MRYFSVFVVMVVFLTGCGGQLQTRRMFNYPNFPKDQIAQVLVSANATWVFKNHKSLSELRLNGKPVSISGVTLLHLVPGDYTLTGKYTAVRYLVPQSKAKRNAAMVGGFLLLGVFGTHAFTGGTPVGAVVDFRMDFTVEPHHNYCLTRRLNGSKEVFRFQELPPTVTSEKNGAVVYLEITKRTGAYSPVRARLENGDTQKTYYEISAYDTPLVSPDGRKVAFGNNPLFSGKGKAVLVADGVETGGFDGIGFQHVVFSPDSSKVACLVKKEDAWVVLADGEEVGRFDSFFNESGLFFGFPFFSPDSRRIAVAGKIGVRWAVFVDGSRGKLYDDLLPNSPVFSPDSRKVAYGAKLDGKWCVVVDGVESRFYDHILWDSIVFSPDGEHVAFSAVSGDKVFVVHDGREGQPHEDILPGTPVFSKDNLHCAYAGKDNGLWSIFVDGEKTATYQNINVYFDGTSYRSLWFEDSSAKLVCETVRGLRETAVGE